MAATYTFKLASARPLSSNVCRHLSRTGTEHLSGFTFSLLHKPEKSFHYLPSSTLAVGALVVVWPVVVARLASVARKLQQEILPQGTGLGALLRNQQPIGSCQQLCDCIVLCCEGLKREEGLEGRHKGGRQENGWTTAQPGFAHIISTIWRVPSPSS